MSAATHFINVDLDIRSAQDLNPLATAIGASTDVLHCDHLENGEWILVVEIQGSPASAEVAIAGLLDVVESLPDSAQRLWRGARRRSFDIGVEASDGPTWKTELTPATLRRLETRGLRIDASHHVLAIMQLVDAAHYAPPAKRVNARSTTGSARSASPPPPSPMRRGRGTSA